MYSLTAAVVVITGALVSAASNSNKNLNASTKPRMSAMQRLQSDLPKPDISKTPKIAPHSGNGKSQTKAQNDTIAKGAGKESAKITLNVNAKEFKPSPPSTPHVHKRLTQPGSKTPKSMASRSPAPKATSYLTPGFVPSPVFPTFLTSHVPNPVYSASKLVTFTVENLKAALPPSLSRSICELGSAGDVIKGFLQDFFGDLHNVSNSHDMNRVFNIGITSLVSKIGIAATSQPGTRCNKELLSLLDAFLRCYTAVYKVCDGEMREYLRENGFIRSIKYFTFTNKDRKQFDDLFAMVEERNAGRMNKENLYHLGFSFIRYFRLLVSSKMMTEDFEGQIIYLFNDFELFLKNTKNRQDIKSPVVVGDVLTVGFRDLRKFAPKYAFATSNEIPSMLIAPFRIYITSMFQKAHRHLLPTDPSNQTIAEAAKSDVALFWAFVEPAFAAFDVVAKHSWSMIAGYTTQAMTEMQLMHYDYLQYYLNTHIFGSIELAVNHFRILKQSKAMILEDSKTLLKAYFKYEQARLDYPDSLDYSKISALPLINQPTPYDEISGPGISYIMSSIYEQMSLVPTFDLLPEMVNELIVITRVLSSMANNFWFPNSNDKFLCSGNFLRLESKFKLPQLLDTTSQRGYYEMVNALYKNGFSDEYVSDDYNQYAAYGHGDKSSNVFGSGCEEYYSNLPAPDCDECSSNCSDSGNEDNSGYIDASDNLADNTNDFSDSGYEDYGNNYSAEQFAQVEEYMCFSDDSYNTNVVSFDNSSLRQHPVIQAGISENPDEAANSSPEGNTSNITTISSQASTNTQCGHLDSN